MIQRNMKLGRNLYVSLSFANEDLEMVTEIGETIPATLLLSKPIAEIGVQPIFTEMIDVPIRYFYIKDKEGYEGVSEAILMKTVLYFLVSYAAKDVDVDSIEKYKAYVQNILQPCTDAMEIFDAIDFNQHPASTWRSLSQAFQLYLYSKEDEK